MEEKNLVDRLKDAEERLESPTERLHPVMLRGIFRANSNRLWSAGKYEDHGAGPLSLQTRDADQLNRHKSRRVY